MPKIRIDILEGKSDAYKQQLLNIAHDALVEAIKIPTGTASRSCTNTSIRTSKFRRARRTTIRASRF